MKDSEMREWRSQNAEGRFKKKQIIVEALWAGLGMGGLALVKFG